MAGVIILIQAGYRTWVDSDMKNFFAKMFYLCLFVLTIFMLASCSGRQLLNPNQSLLRLKSGGSWRDEVDFLVNPLIKNKENVGIVVGILDAQGKAYIFPYGFKNKKHQIPMTVNTLFAIGSSSKSLVVSLMLALDERGIISIDEKIGELLPTQLKLKDPRVKDITFAQLASHTSGLPREPVNLKSLGALVYYYFTGDNIYQHLTEEVIFSYLAEYELPEELSDTPTYSNIGIGLLGYFLTQKTGHDLDALLKQYIFKPLNMQDTHVTLKPEDEDLLSIGHAGDQPYFIPWNTPLENWVFSNVMQGTGGIYSSAPDLIQYLKAHLSQSNTSLDHVLKKSRKILGKDGSHYLTMGWYVDYLPDYKTHLYYYHGMIAGFNSYIGFEPETQVAVVVLRNNFNWIDKVGHNLLLRMSQQAKKQAHLKP